MYRDIVEVIPENYDGSQDLVGWEIQMSEATVERLDEKLNYINVFDNQLPGYLRALLNQRGS